MAATGQNNVGKRAFRDPGPLIQLYGKMRPKTNSLTVLRIDEQSQSRRRSELNCIEHTQKLLLTDVIEFVKDEHSGIQVGTIKSPGKRVFESKVTTFVPARSMETSELRQLGSKELGCNDGSKRREMYGVNK